MLCEPFVRMKCHTTDGDTGSGCFIWIKSPDFLPKPLVCSVQAGISDSLCSLNQHNSFSPHSPGHFLPVFSSFRFPAKEHILPVFLPLFLRKDDAPLAHPLPCQQLSPTRVRSSSRGGTGAAASFSCDSEAAQSPISVTLSPKLQCWCCFPSSFSPGAVPGYLPMPGSAPSGISGTLWTSLGTNIWAKPFSYFFLWAPNLLKVPKRKMPSSTLECAIPGVRRGRNLNIRHSLFCGEDEGNPKNKGP